MDPAILSFRCIYDFFWLQLHMADAIKQLGEASCIPHLGHLLGQVFERRPILFLLQNHQILPPDLLIKFGRQVFQVLLHAGLVGSGITLHQLDFLNNPGF
jgi:hypothetical protein